MEEKKVNNDTARFLEYCTKYGGNIIVDGDLRVFGGGKLYAGNRILIKATELYTEFFIDKQASLYIGDNVFINRGVKIACSEKIVIGNNCSIAEDCFLIDNDFHAIEGSTPKIAPIILENNVWLALRVMVLKGVTIGEGSTIGAGAVVTKSIPPYTFAAGNPARVIRKLDKNKIGHRGI